jgi:hypothetical protein
MSAFLSFIIKRKKKGIFTLYQLSFWGNGAKEVKNHRLRTPYLTTTHHEDLASDNYLPEKIGSVFLII